MAQRINGIPVGAARSLLRVDTPQVLTAAQAAQARYNLAESTPNSIAGNVTLSMNAGLRRIQVFGGAYTATLPTGVFNGYVTGEFRNYSSGFFGTVSPPSGVAMDGVVDGTVKVSYLQAVKFYLDADGWHTVWVDKTPVILPVSAPVGTAFFDVAIPAGYRFLQFDFFNFVPSTNGCDFGFTVSNDGGTTFRNAASSYTRQISGASGTTASNAITSYPYAVILENISNNALFATSGASCVAGSIDAKYGGAKFFNGNVNAGPSNACYFGRAFQNYSASPITNINLIRFAAFPGTFAIEGFIRGIP